MLRQPDGLSSADPPAAGHAPPGTDREWVLAAVRRYERPLIAYATHLTGRLETARDVV